MNEANDDTLKLAKLCAHILDEQKMKAIKVFDIREATPVADSFVLASGGNPRQVKAAGEKLVRELRQRGLRPRGLEGLQEGKWVLVDLLDVVVHLFTDECRRYYDLELLWGDCPLVEWQEEPLPGERSRERLAVEGS